MSCIESVLIVEDNEMDILVCERNLQINNFGGEIYKADSIESGINVINQLIEQHICLPKVIFLDMFFGDQTGEDFLNFFDSLDEELKSHVKIVVVSATKLLFEFENVKKRPHIYDVMDKPFDFSKLNSLFFNDGNAGTCVN